MLSILDFCQSNNERWFNSAFASSRNARAGSVPAARSAGNKTTANELIEIINNAEPKANGVARQNPKCASKAILQRVSQHEMG